MAKRFRRASYCLAIGLWDGKLYCRLPLLAFALASIETRKSNIELKEKVGEGNETKTRRE